MSETTLKARLVHPCKTDAEWASSNPVAKKGEIMISSDKSGMFKVGNGTSKWSDLQYNHVTWSNVEGKPSTFTPSSHTHDDRYYTETEINDKVTALNNSIATKVTEKTITEAVDLNTLTTTGVYHIKTSISSALHGPTTSQGTLYVDFSVGTPYQLFVPDANTLNWYKRSYNKTSKTWAGWITIYNSDTVYTHPSYTAYASGLYKITTNSLGHVTSATAVTKGDITALGIPGSNTDSKVLQTAVKASDYTNWRTVLWGSSNNATEGFTPTTVTDSVFSSQTLTFQPSTGTLKANTFKGNLSGNATSASAVAWSGITGKPSTYAPSSHTHTKSQITDFPTLGTAASKNTRTLTSASHSSWANASTDQGYVPDMAFIAYWNGAFSSNGASNLAYCNRGAFGTIVTKNAGDYASAGHTHNYAGSSSVGGSANSAVKLDTTTAGSATQPVYFSGGKPVACTYTLGKSVPSNAVFTDTNTWRPLGTTADTACAGNDSRLSNARPASDVYSWAKASSKPSYSWNEIGSKPSTFTPSSHSHASITRADHLDSVNKLNAFIETNTFKYGTIGALDGLDGLAKNDGIILSASWKDSTKYGHQMYLDDNGYTIAHRYNNNGTWSAWKTLIDSSNYTSYTVTKTGSGASGTWGISISGNAATATTASSANSVAWGNVSGKPSTYTPSSHKHSKSQITDFPTSMPASDVYAWAKASSKPSYSWGEITGKPSSFTPSSHTHDYLPLSGGTVTGDLKVNKSVSTNGLEIYHTSTPFIDFHYNNDSSVDYTSRIIELEKGKLNVNGAVFTNGGTIWGKGLSIDGTGTFNGDLSATRGLKLNHGGTSLYLYNETGNFCIMHTGTDGTSTWPIVWDFKNDNLAIANSINCGAYGTFGKGIISKSESVFHTGTYTDPLPGVTCAIKASGIVTSTRFYVKGRSSSWLSGAQPGGAGFECVNDTDSNALIPGWRIRNASGAWVGSSYNMDKAFHLYYAKAERLSGNTDNGTDADFVFYASTGQFAAKSVTQTSDERRKSIISSSILDSYKDFFMKIKPFSFKWKDGQDDTSTHLGVGAQSVYQAALDCGFTDDDLGFIHKGKEYPGTSIPWSVSYTEFIPLNIAVTQDHETRIEKLERENEELKQQIKELKGLTA